MKSFFYFFLFRIFRQKPKALQLFLYTGTVNRIHDYGDGNSYALLEYSQDTIKPAIVAFQDTVSFMPVIIMRSSL